MGAGVQWTLTRGQAGPQPALQRLFFKQPPFNCYPTHQPCPTLTLSGQRSCSQTQALSPRTTVVSVGLPPKCDLPGRERPQALNLLPWDTWRHVPPRILQGHLGLIVPRSTLLDHRNASSAWGLGVILVAVLWTAVVRTGLRLIAPNLTLLLCPTSAREQLRRSRHSRTFLVEAGVGELWAEMQEGEAAGCEGTPQTTQRTFGGLGQGYICEAYPFPQSAAPHPTHSCTPNSFLQEIRFHVQPSNHPPCTLCIFIW